MKKRMKIRKDPNKWTERDWELIGDRIRARRDRRLAAEALLNDHEKLAKELAIAPKSEALH